MVNVELLKYQEFVWNTYFCKNISSSNMIYEMILVSVFLIIIIIYFKSWLMS